MDDAAIVDRSVRGSRARAEDEVGRLLRAALDLLAEQGGTFTVSDVLAASGLSTRAFYRHFQSKDELVLAVYATETSRADDRLRSAVASASSPREALERWVDATLALARGKVRAARTAILWREGSRLRHVFPERFAAMLDAAIGPLVDVLEAGRADGTFPAADPIRDARSIHAVVWTRVERTLGGERAPGAEDRDALVAFCLRALGSAP